MQLAEHPVLAELSEADRAKLVDRFQPVHAPRGSKLYVERQDVAGVYFVESGFVKITRTSPEGTQVLLELAGPGDVFGPCCDPFSRAANPCTAEVQTAASLMHLPSERFHALAAEDAGTTHLVVGMLCASKRGCVDLAVRIAFWSVEQRLASLLLALSRHARQTGVPCELPPVLTQDEMAQAVGSVREVVTRCLGRFQEARLIRRRGRRIIIEDAAGLAAMNAALPRPHAHGGCSPLTVH